MNSELGEIREIEWRGSTHLLFAALPAAYDECRNKMRDLNLAFKSELASTFQTRFNHHIQTLPQNSYAEKQALASLVNHELHELDLTIKCPKTGKPAILVADIKDGHDGTSRFRLEIRSDDGRKVRTRTSTQLFDLELMAAMPRAEGLARWDRK